MVCRFILILLILILIPHGHLLGWRRGRCRGWRGALVRALGVIITLTSAQISREISSDPPWPVDPPLPHELFRNFREPLEGAAHLFWREQ